MSAGKRFSKPYRVKRKRPVYKSRYFWFSIFVFLVVGGLGYLGFFDSVFQIKDINISGADKISSSEIHDFISQSASNKFAFLVSKSIFLLNSSKISQDILKKYPLIEKINIKRNFPNVLAATIQERTAIAIFCQQEICYHIDQNGVAFEKTSDASLFTITSDAKTAINLGNTVIDQKIIQNILDLTKLLTQNFQINAKNFLIVNNQTRMNLTTSEGWQAYFDLTEDLTPQIANLNLVLSQKISASERGKLNYIDLRYGNKVFYK